MRISKLAIASAEDMCVELLERGEKHAASTIANLLAFIEELAPQANAESETLREHFQTWDYVPEHSMHEEGGYFYACEACSGLADGERQ